MENELLAKGLAEVRRARAAVDEAGAQASARLATAQTALEDASFQMTIAILMNGGVRLGVTLGTICSNRRYSSDAVQVTSVTRQGGDLHEVIWGVAPRRAGNSDLRVLEARLRRHDAQAIAAALTKAQYALRQYAPGNCAQIAVGGYFFRLVGDKYEVLA